jgi:hypothetical protein
MGYKFNPFTGNLDTTDSPNGVFEEIEVNGDITLDDGGTYATTLQTITPTAARTISFPDATGTVGLVGGSSGNLVVNQSGAYAGVANSSVDNATGNITLGSRFISSLNGAASAPPGTFTGIWFTGGTATTTKPQALIEPTGATSTAWSTSGTGLGVNAASGFAGNLLDLQLNGTSRAIVTGAGLVGIGTTSPSYLLHVDAGTGLNSILVSGQSSGSGRSLRVGHNASGQAEIIAGSAGGVNNTLNVFGSPIIFGLNVANERARIDSSGRLLVGTNSDSGGALFQVNGDRIRVGTAKTPATSGATGTTGEIAWDADYIYVCTATDTWKRTAISTW